MPEEQKKLRAYILGEIGEKERQEIEERLMTDEDFFRELSLVEETVIQEYADGKLTAAERAKFEKGFLVSEENRRKVRFARALRKYVNETESPKSQTQREPTFFDSLKAFFLSPVPVTLAVLIFLSVGGFWIWRSFSAARSESLIALNEAYRTERPLESRITDLDYAPTKNTRGAGDNDKTDKIKLALARETALRAVSENPSAENLHILARVYLAEKKFNDAIEQFEKAVKLAPEDAKLHNDFGAALLEKGSSLEDGRLDNLTKANEEFAKAIKLDNNLVDAYFNQALTIQKLNLPGQAKEAWQKYLELDSGSPWAEEARKNLEQIETSKPISKTKEELLQEFLEARQSNDDEKAWQTLSRNREMITGKLIPQQLAFFFVKEKSDGNEQKAEEFLNALVFAGKLEEKKSGDLFWKEVAKYYSEKRNYSELKVAHHLVSEGYELSLKSEYQKSLKNFETAEEIFRRNANVWEAKICDYWKGSLLYRLHKINQSTEIYKQMAEFSETGNFKWLASQAYTKLSLNAGIGLLDKYSKAIEYNEKALKFAEETEDLYGMQKILSQIAYEYKQVGRYNLSLKYCEKSLKIAVLPEASRRETYRTYYSASYTFYKMKFYDISAHYQKEALALAKELKDKTFLHNANLYLGKIQVSQEKYDEAQKFLEESIVVANSFSDKEEREKAIALSNFEFGNLKRQIGKCDEAQSYYQNAVTFYDSSEYKLNRYETHKGYLQCLLKTHNQTEIDQEFSILFNIFRKYRKEIIEEQNRESFFDNEQTVYDLAIDYEESRGDSEKAFDYSEESSSRILLDLLDNRAQPSNGKTDVSLSSDNFEPVNVSDIRSQIPDSVQIVKYAVLPDRIAIWLITKEEFLTFSSQISNEELKNKVYSHLQLISDNQTQPGEANLLAAELYKFLIEPVKDRLDNKKQICIIPDKFLFKLSFASLISNQTGQYFIAEQDFVLSPSANVFLLNSKKAEELKSLSEENILSIGNPSFDTELFSDLPKLPSAEDEANNICRIYSKSICLSADQASKTEVVRNFKDTAVIHFAGHYLVNENLPLLSGLVLSGSTKKDDLLTNYEIMGENFSKTRLVVLSACQTGVEKYYQGEGMIGAARTFLAKGIPLVVGSQWAVESDATSELMKKFHFYRKGRGLATAGALRQAQLDMLNGNNEKFKHPYYWASFTSIGGYAEF